MGVLASFLNDLLSTVNAVITANAANVSKYLEYFKLRKKFALRLKKMFLIKKMHSSLHSTWIEILFFNFWICKIFLVASRIYFSENGSPKLSARFFCIYRFSFILNMKF